MIAIGRQNRGLDGHWKVCFTKLFFFHFSQSGRESIYVCGQYWEREFSGR